MFPSSKDFQAMFPTKTVPNLSPFCSNHGIIYPLEKSSKIPNLPTVYQPRKYLFDFFSQKEKKNPSEEGNRFLIFKGSKYKKR